MKKFIWIIVLILFVAGVAWLITTPGKGGQHDALAMCIKDSGAKFYGAFWFSHCQNQKAMFGASSKLLPYIECSTPDGQGQLPICTEAGISGYPTWEFADGSRKGGEIPLVELAELTNCPFAQE